MPITYKVKHLGDEVDDIPTSLLVEINRWHYLRKLKKILILQKNF
jgi:hypothetical protein